MALAHPWRLLLSLAVVHRLLTTRHFGHITRLPIPPSCLLLSSLWLGSFLLLAALVRTIADSQLINQNGKSESALSSKAFATTGKIFPSWRGDFLALIFC
jgi:hypothetical protein